jgi:CMP-N-acetylneuraminic acid synthetase
MNIVAMVPARMGSERLKMKNLALLNGQPLISYAI